VLVGLRHTSLPLADRHHVNAEELPELLLERFRRTRRGLRYFIESRQQLS